MKPTRRPMLTWGVRCAMLALAACGDAAGPDDTPPVATSLAHGSSALLTGTVGSRVSDVPSVIVRDASGDAMAGVAITFRVVSGGGTISEASTVSSPAGIARLGSWTLGHRPGVNVLAATDGSR